MNSKKYHPVLAGLMCIALGACGTANRGTGMNDSYGETYGESVNPGGPITNTTNPVTGPSMAGSSAGIGSTSSGAPMGASGSEAAQGGASGTAATPAMGSSGQTDSTAGSMGSAGMAGAPAGSAATEPGQAQAITAYGVVQSIDTMSRAQALGGAGAGMGSQSGGSGTATGSGSASDVAYRLTLRMDDGTTRTVTQESPPALQIGDRVRVANGMVQRY